MELFHNNSARRREVRRGMPQEPSRWREWLERRDILDATLLALVLATLAWVMAIGAQNRSPYVEGQVVPASVVSRVEFVAKDESLTDKAKEDAREREPSVYAANPEYFRFIREKFGLLASIATNPSYSDVTQVRPKLNWTQKGFVELRKYFAVNGQPQQAWTDLTNELTDELAKMAILTPEQARIELNEKQRAQTIVIQPPGAPNLNVYRNEIFSLGGSGGDDARIFDRIEKKAREKFGEQLSLAIAGLMSQNPNAAYVFNKDLTDQAKRVAFLKETPVTKSYHADDVLITAGKRVTANDAYLLERERQAYVAHLAEATWHRPWLAKLGLFGLMAFISAGFWAYILAVNPRVAVNRMRGVAFTALLLLAQLMAVAGTLAYPSLSYLTATFPTLMVGVVLAIVYDRRFAMASAALHTLLVMLTLNLSPEFAFVMLVGLAIAVSQLDAVRTRAKVAFTGFWAGLGMAGAVMVAGLATRPLLVGGQLWQTYYDACWALLSGSAVGILIQQALPIIEKLFRITTSLKLAELNDATKPLLRRLAQEAPGTYQHSLRVSDMAEAAAQAIGADGLLCKVGAMYHDIGKINKPGYFVENQAGGPNKHDKLAPPMSLLIIVGHVKDGVEMAREYRLPASIRQFIESHHGTTLVEYFYHAARKQYEGNDAPSEFEYRYGGPKPQTREAAILMLCDSIEGASRSLTDPTPTKFEMIVQSIAQKRLADGQFDECSITLQEMHKIEQSIVKTLVATYHGRIAYPKDVLQPSIAAS